MLIHLLPEQLAGFRLISIIEAIRITGTYPIFQTVLDRLHVHPSPVGKLLEMFSACIELRPYGNHQTPVHGMYGIDHALRVRKTLSVKLMAAPFILFPMQPVNDNVIDRNPTLTELFQSRKHFFLRIIFLTTLPITHRPFRHNLRLPCQRTITTDHVIHVFAINKVIVYLILHFAPPGQFILLILRDRCQHSKPTIRNSSIRLPINLNGNTFACLQLYSELITVRIPRCTPTLRHHQLIVYINFCITGIIQNETE